ncbi:MAG TPA: hypothetical protein VF813_00120 [Anaerolineaceae bacterium]
MAGRSWDFAASDAGAARTIGSRARTRLELLLSTPRFTTWGGILVLWGVLLAGILPTLLAHAAPSGADPGNWLDLAWTITGQGARLSTWAYPPLSFFLLRGLLFIFAPLAAVKVYGLISVGFMLAALWLALDRGLPRLPALVKLGIAAVFGLAGYNAEIYAWGGYPQILGTAFLLLCLPALEETLRTGSKRAAAIAVLSALGIIFVHHMIAALLPVLWVGIFLWTFFLNRRTGRMVWSRFWRASLAVAVPAMLALPIYLRYAALLAGSPTNSNGFSFASLSVLIQYVFRNLSPLWISLLVVAMTAPFLARRARISGSALVLTWGVLLPFLFLWEVRLLQLVYMGMAFGLGLLFEAAWNTTSSPVLARVRHGLLAGGLILALIPGLSQAHVQYLQAADYYRVADDAILPGISWIGAHVPPGERIASSRTRPDLLGWWIEGLAKRPTLAATDLRWLSFKSEKVYAAAANEIFDPKTPVDRITALLVQYQVRWLFIDKKAETSDLSALIEQGVLQGAYEDSRVLILRVKPPNG